VNPVPNPAPVISSLSPEVSIVGYPPNSLYVFGSDFVPGSTVYWGTTALHTDYQNATKLIAIMTAAQIASPGITAITVQTPAPGGGTSNTLQFEVDSAGSTSPTLNFITATVSAGSPATYSVTLPSTVESATVSCLNPPTGVSCSYSATTNILTISTSSITPKGTYQITVVFTETVAGAAAGWILLPILLLPLMMLRKKLAARGDWVTACLVLLLLASSAVTITGCGGSSNTTPPQTHQVTASAAVLFTVQ
jgi:hypothetical protein